MGIVLSSVSPTLTVCQKKKMFLFKYYTVGYLQHVSRVVQRNLKHSIIKAKIVYKKNLRRPLKAAAPGKLDKNLIKMFNIMRVIVRSWMKTNLMSIN